MPAIVSTAPYGCHNAPPAKATIDVMDGWTPSGRRKVKTIPSFAAGAVCRYDDRRVDPRCAGCREAK